MRRALVIEDDNDFRVLACTALSDRGFTTLDASSGQEAESILRKQSVDVIVVDSALSDGSGVDWIARLRSRDRATPILFMSAAFLSSAMFRRLTGELEVAYVLYKPLEPRDLARRAGDLVGTTSETLRISQYPSGKPALANALLLLRREFGSKLPAKLEELRLAVMAAERDRSQARVACALAHRLRGTAGSYGYAAVGEAAGRLEDLLLKLDTRDEPNPTFFWGEAWKAIEDARLSATHAPGEIEGAGDGVALVSKPLLVVDDDPEFLTLVRDVSRRLAISVLTTQDAAEAMQLARTRPLLGALLDVHPAARTSAFAVAAAIRRTRGNESIPLAFMSQDRALETRLAAIEAGGTSFFEKPLSSHTFASLLQQFESLSAAAGANVLVIDDDPDVIADYAARLRPEGIRVDAVLTADAIFERLEKGSPDLLILDVNLPNVSGLDVCRAVRMSDRWKLLPILIATANGDANTRLQAFRAGASDVLIKPILPEELLARVQVQLDRVRLVRDQSEKDTLSGLLLRRPFLEALERAFSLASRENKPLSLALLDLDNFKRINDTYGHMVGDAVIAGLGALLRRKFRMEDLRGRWGGEEFIIAFPGQTADVTGRLVTRLLSEFAELQFGNDVTQPVSATFSAGVATFPTDGNTIAMLIKRADERLYQSKRGGRNRVTLAPPEDAAAPLPIVTVEIK